MYAYSTIGPSPDGNLRIVAADLGETFECEITDRMPLGGPLALHKGVYNRVVRDFNGGRPLPLTLTTFCEAPAGSGLGSSSTLVVSMIKAYTELLNLPLGEYETAYLAYEIERLDLGLSGGRQDQYAATFGGFNFIEFYDDDRVIVNPLHVKNWIINELEASLVLYYTGVSRESAAIIDEQMKNVTMGETDSVAATNELKQSAVAMKESLLKGDIRGLADNLECSWQAKKRTAGKVTNTMVDEIYERAKKAGAIAGKISGAGGGGYMMLLVDPVRRPDVVRALNGEDGQVMSCHFTKWGTQGWRTA